ncbi:MAG TPA: transglycosylase SLT domain-containing protein [Paracoccaceae bacterium]|nr:transglycosylase SLT domain-containing protein [Paracoccaceae bacterium]
MGEQSTRPGIRRLCLSLTLLAVGSCAISTARDGISNPHDVCVILREQPDWYRAARRTEARWGTPAELVFAIIWRESGFRAEAKTPRTYFLGIVPAGRVSTAYGYAQAIDGTWDWYRRETGNRSADRRDFRDAADFVGWYTGRTRDVNGIPLADAFNQYLAYHEGHRGYQRGDWRGKAGLLMAAAQVRDQAGRYRSQLATCA